MMVSEEEGRRRPKSTRVLLDGDPSSFASSESSNRASLDRDGASTTFPCHLKEKKGNPRRGAGSNRDEMILARSGSRRRRATIAATPIEREAAPSLLLMLLLLLVIVVHTHHLRGM